MTALERMARAIQDEGPVGCCMIDDKQALVLARAALMAIREPGETVSKAIYFEDCDGNAFVPVDAWKAGIDAILAETE